MKTGTFYITVFMFLSVFLAGLGTAAEEDVIVPEKFVEPTGTITLQDAIKAALANNPDIAAAMHEINALEGASYQEGLLENPTFFSEFEEFGGSGDFSGDDVLETTVGLSQEIPLAGKRAKRVRIAEHETNIARLELQAKILALTSDVKKRFLRVHSLEQGVLMERENMTLLQDVQKVISRQTALGDISPLDERKATVELSIAKAALARTERELDIARIELASSWGSSDVHFDQVEFIDNLMQPFPKEEELWLVAQAHPELEISRMQVERLKASLALATAEATPDLELEGGVKYFNESNDHAYFLGFSIPIPIFDRNKGGIREASENIQVGKKELQGLSLSKKKDLAVLLDRLQIVDSELRTAEKDIIPAAQETYEALKKAYQAGENDYLELVDSQRTLLEVRRNNLFLEREHHELIADLEAIIGKDIQSLSQGHLGISQ